MDERQELEGRVALVTGASRNIGRAIALSLADGGAKVVVNARKSLDEARAVVKEIEARGGKAVASLADVTDEQAVMTMVRATCRSLAPTIWAICTSLASSVRTPESVAK